ncbi:hypothetical protein BS17DRAFT_780163 [Gyrodon lividus]|nr:hypothetical protein BS17DRAFT_780163 [Gyrodon lividus]
MGLSDLPLPVTPPRIIAENILTAVPAVTRRSSPLPSPSPSSENKSCPRSHSPQSPSAKPVRIPSGKYHERDPFPTGDTHDPDEDKPETKARARAQARLQTQSRGSDSDSSLDDFSTLSYAHASTPIRTSRPPRINPYTHSQEQTQTQTQTRRQLGRVVRNFVKRMLSPSSGVGGGVGSAGGTRGTSSEPRPHPHVRHVDATSTKKRHTLLVRTPGTGNEREGTPRSDTSGRSGWTFASVGSWTAPPECQQAHGSNRWSGLWH